jgi:hypothetical protein
VTDPEHVSGRQPGNCGHKPVEAARRNTVPKHRRRLSPEWERLARLLIAAIEPIAKLIDAISRIR